VAAVEAGDDVVDERGLGLVGMDAEGFGGQCGLLSVGVPPPGYRAKSSIVVT
jgi:hypothetical protein